MDDKKRFPEQTAPDKNTDKAFVKVSRDGSPLIPGRENAPKDKAKDKPASLQPKK